MKSLLNGILYAFVVAAAVSASATVFLVAIEVRESAGMGGFLLSLLAFPLTWVVGPIVLAASGNATLMPLLAFSLMMTAPPLLATWSARRAARRRAEARVDAKTTDLGEGRPRVTSPPRPEPMPRPHPLAIAPLPPQPRPMMPPPPPRMAAPRSPGPTQLVLPMATPGPVMPPNAAVPLHPPAAS